MSLINVLYCVGLCWSLALGWKILYFSAMQHKKMFIKFAFYKINK